MVTPVAVWTAEPSELYKIYPKVIFYISTDDYKVGEIVDVASFGQIATIDFTGKEQTYAYVTKQKDGTYGRVTYEFGLKDPEELNTEKLNGARMIEEKADGKGETKVEEVSVEELS